MRRVGGRRAENSDCPSGRSRRGNACCGIEGPWGPEFIRRRAGGRRAPAFRQRLQGQLQHGIRSLAPHRRCGCLFQYSCELRRRQGHRLWTRMSARLAAALKLKSGWRCQTQCPRVAPRAHRTSTARSQGPAAAGAATVTLHGRAQRASSCTCCLLIAARSTPPADTRRSCPATGRSPGAAPSLRTMRDCTISLWWST